WARGAGYEIEEVLTFGVRDIVYKARGMHQDRVGALKVITTAVQEEPGELERLRQEAMLLARLAHSNIVSIYTSGVHKGRTYLFYEFVEGGSLIGRFEDRPASPGEAAALVGRLAEAMQYAHERGALHCALKPSNV